MTKISQLNTLSSVDNSAVLPVVSNNATYKATVGNLNGSSSGTASTFGGLVSPDEMYGTVASVQIFSDAKGAGYSSGTTYAAAHNDSEFDKVPGINNATYNSKKFIARGLHVRVTSVGTNNSVGSLEITNPGQLYKVGDVLDISPWRVKYNTADGGTTDTNVTSLCKIKVTEVNPFIVGHGLQNNLGGSVEHLYTEGVASPHDPNTGLSGSDGLKGYKMEEDSSASLFSEAHDSTLGGDDQDQSGTRSTWLGARSDSSPGQFSIALPGHWFLVHHTKLLSNTTGDSRRSFSYISYNEGQNPMLSDSLIPSAGNVYSDTSTSAINVGGVRVINANHNYHYDTGSSYGDFNSIGDYSNTCLHYCSKNIESTFNDAKNTLGDLPSFLDSGATNWGAYIPNAGSFSAQKFYGVWDATLVAENRGSRHVDRTVFYDTTFYNGSFSHSFYFVPVYAILPKVS